MMTGVVNANLEAMLRLTVFGPGGQVQDVETLIDTGFNGFLTLPPALIAVLGLPWLGYRQVRIADGNQHLFDVYSAAVLWHGQSRAVEVEAVDAQPLLGMDLLQTCELRIQVVPGGPVMITPP
jgi:clan AA aspartic protease